MHKKEFGLGSNSLFMNVKSPTSLLVLKNNKSFCMGFFTKNKITSIISDSENTNGTNELVYDLSRSNNVNAEALGTILDLLTQLRAASSEQNVFVQNNTVLREQILNQLKNEVLKVSHKLTNNQIKNLEVLSNNNFDEKTLTDILRKLLKSSKKKLADGDAVLADTLGHSLTGISQASRERFTPLTFQSVQSKLSKINVSTKVGSFIKDIVQNSNSRIKTSRSELINKVIDGRKLQEFDDTVINIYEKRKQDKTRYEKNIKYLYDEIEKFYSAKRIFQNISKISQGTDVKKSSILENVRTNLLKLTTKTDIAKERRYTQDTAIERVSKRHLSEHSKMINRLSDTVLNVEEREAIKDVVDLRRSGKIFERRDYETKNVHKHLLEFLDTKSHKFTFNDFDDYVLKYRNIIKDIRVYKSNFRRSRDHVKRDTVDNHEIDKFNTHFLELSNLKSNKFTFNDFEDYVVKYKGIHEDSIKRNAFVIKRNQIVQEIEKRIKEELVSINEKNLYDKFNVITRKKDKKFLKRMISKFLPLTSDSKSVDSVRRTQEDVYRFIPHYATENILNKEKIENLISSKIFNMYSPRVRRIKKIVTSTKNINTTSVNDVVDKYIENIYDLKKEYLLHDKGIAEQNFNYDHINRTYMVHKEKEKYVVPPGDSKSSKESEKEYQEVPDIEYETKREEPIDVKAIEKNIMAKTLTKEDIVSLIRSYVKDINVESISDSIVSKIEHRSSIEKRRRGIF